MKERNFQSEFNRWAKYNVKESSAFELKLEKGHSMPFSAVQPHQIANLQLAKHGRLAYKIEDGTYSPKPFDCFVLAEVPAYVVVMFYKRAQKEFFMIAVDKYVEEVEKSDRKSLTEDRAKEIGIECRLS